MSQKSITQVLGTHGLLEPIQMFWAYCAQKYADQLLVILITKELLYWTFQLVQHRGADLNIPSNFLLIFSISNIYEIVFKDFYIFFIEEILGFFFLFTCFFVCCFVVVDFSFSYGHILKIKIDDEADLPRLWDSRVLAATPVSDLLLYGFPGSPPPPTPLITAPSPFLSSLVPSKCCYLSRVFA